MYGLLNKGIQKLVENKFGHPFWEQVKEEANVDQDHFVTLDAYDDRITYNLVAAISKLAGIDQAQFLFEYGEFWISFVLKEGYGDLLSFSGNTFAEVLLNVNELHTRLEYTHENLRPPSFKCEEINEHCLRFEYHSFREGLSNVVMGIIQGLGKHHEVLPEIEHTKARAECGFDEFIINYKPI